jgi:hypothetical protein
LSILLAHAFETRVAQVSRVSQATRGQTERTSHGESCAALLAALQFDHAGRPQMVERIVHAAAIVTVSVPPGLAVCVVGIVELFGCNHAFVDDGIARFKRKQQMIPADAAIEARKAIERLGTLLSSEASLVVTSSGPIALWPAIRAAS